MTGMRRPRHMATTKTGGTTAAGAVSLRGALLGAATLLLAACSGANVGGPSPGGPIPSATPTGPAAPGSTIGTGSVKVALLLPLSAGGAAGNTATVLRNAAEMAIAEFQGPDVTILVKDDGGTAAGAQAATQAAIQEGAELILGPLLAESVRGAAAVARPAGKPIIAYSTDTSVATRGVYLMSFTPQTTVDRIVQHAAQTGKRSYAAFVPDSAFGQVVQGAFQEAVSRSGGRVVAIETFPLDPAGVNAAASKLSGIAGQIDAVFVPDPYDGAAVRALSTAGIDTRRVQILGVGPWVGNRAAAQAAPTALYAAPRRGRVPELRRPLPRPLRPGPRAHRLAHLRFGLAHRRPGPHPGLTALLRNRADQLVRLQRRRRPLPLPRRRLAQRGLAVIQAGGRVVSPAPRSFAGGS